MPQVLNFRLNLFYAESRSSQPTWPCGTVFRMAQGGSWVRNKFRHLRLGTLKQIQQPVSRGIRIIRNKKMGGL